MMRELSEIELVRPWSIWNMYLSVLITNATVYFTLFAMSRAAFDLQGYAPDIEFTPEDDKPTDQGGGIITDGGGPGELSDLTTYNDPVAVYIFFLYFSTAIITSTGFGDIIPTRYYSQMQTNFQMLVGLVYHAGVFGFALDHFLRLQKRRHAAQQSEKRRLLAEAEVITRQREMTLLVAIQDDSIVREAADSPSAPLSSSSSLSLDGDVPPQRMLLRSPSISMHQRSGSLSFRASNLPDDDAADSDFDSDHSETRSADSGSSSPINVTQRVILSNPSSPIKTEEQQQQPREQKQMEEDEDFGGLEPMDMELPTSNYPMLFGLPNPSATGGSTVAASSNPSSSTPLSSIKLSSVPSSSSHGLHVKPKKATFLGQFSFWRELKKKAWFETIRRGMIDYLLPLQFLLYILSSSLMFTVSEPFLGLAGATGSSLVGKEIVLFFACVFLLLSLALNGGASVRLFNKIAGGTFTEVLDARGEVVARIPKEGVTAGFLTQSYLANILVFASIYFFLFTYSPSHEFSRAKDFDLSVIDVWFTFGYFSVTGMTGCGFGDIYARGTLSRTVAAVQMLISISYACIVIGLGMLVMCEQLERKAHTELQEKEKKISALLQVVVQKRSSTNSSTRGSTIGSPSRGKSETIDPPLLELLHHPELLRAIHEPVTEPRR